MIKYFTAQIKTYTFDLQKVHRQQFYIRAVSMLPRVKVIEGFYTKHKIRMPFYKEPCIVGGGRFRFLKSRIDIPT